MAANPPLVRHMGQQALMPAPFAGESFVFRRDGIEIDLDNVQTRTKRWKADGCLYVSNVRVVFVALKPHESGLQSFDFPLAYICNEKFNQPIFGCNNLAFRCFAVGDHGGPRGSLPPHDLKLYLKRGGCGTLLPLFFRLIEQTRMQQAAQAAAAQAASYPTVNYNNIPTPAPMQVPTPQPPADVQQMVQTAYIDPNDPTKIYVTQPYDESQVMKEEEKPYEPTGLRP